MTVAATYFDGLSARARPVTLAAEPGSLHVIGEGIDRHVPLAEAEISERLGSAARRIDFAGGGHCEVRDHAGFAQLLAAAGHGSRWVERAQRSWPIIIGSLVAMLLLVGAFYRWGLPRVVVATANQVTPALATALSDKTLELLDDHYLKPSKLVAARQQELIRRLEAIKDIPSPQGSPATGSEDELLFRSGGKLGANALTLPDGRIVLLDELVALGDDEQIIAVLGHERGHAAGRHGLRALVRNTIVGTFAAWWFGDVSQLLVLGPTLLLNTEYSRGLETEADEHAIRMLRINGISPVRLAEMLRKLETSHGEKREGEPRWLRYLATHPDTEARIQRIERDEPAV